MRILTIRARPGGAMPVLILRGEVDLTTADSFEHAARMALARQSVGLALDLAAVGFFSVSGYHVLERLAAEARVRALRLELRALSPAVRRVLDLLPSLGIAEGPDPEDGPGGGSSKPRPRRAPGRPPPRREEPEPPALPESVLRSRPAPVRPRGPSVAGLPALPLGTASTWPPVADRAALCDTVPGQVRHGAGRRRGTIVQDAAPLGTAEGTVVPPPRFAILEEESLTILVAEDDPADLLIAQELLDDSPLEATVICVTTAGQAAAEVTAGDIDCILLDLHLPDLHGLGALGEWLETVPQTAVVVMTGLNDRAAGLAAVQAGAQDYLVKGEVEPQWLDRTIRYAVQRKRTERAAADLRAARWRAAENVRLERGLLPSPLLLAAPVAVTSRYLPHRDGALLGGDFFDVVETADGTVHAVIGDVSGHGPDEAALGVALRVAWRTLVLAGKDGPALIDSLESLLLAERRDDETYATLAMLSWRPGEPSGELIRAGHPGALTRHGGETILHDGEHGPALGLVPGAANWPVAPLRIGEGGEVLLYTDGLYENRDENGRPWGQDRLLDGANRLAGLADGEFVDRLIAATRDRSGRGDRDDVAVLHLRHLAPGEKRAGAPRGSGR